MARPSRFIVAMTGCFWAAVVAAAAGGAAPGIGAPAPAFTLPALDGGQQSLSEHRGQVVLINFWATWCGPCRLEMPVLDSIYQQDKSLGFALLGISVDKTGAAVKPVLNRRPVSFPILLDATHVVSMAYHVEEMPSSVLIDRKGIVRYIHRGYQPGAEQEYLRHIGQLLKE
ncbi:MAG: TlpA family protein disulfide reductase [Pseudomonadota bacterium]|nr:TlpA family protein disulfide reductase [Pseudomonadota bacterium]